MSIIGAPQPGLPGSPEVRAIHKEGDDLSRRLARANDSSQGIHLDNTPTLGKRPGVFTKQ